MIHKTGHQGYLEGVDRKLGDVWHVDDSAPDDRVRVLIRSLDADRRRHLRVEAETKVKS